MVVIKDIKSDFYRYRGNISFTIIEIVKLYFIESGFAFMLWHRLSRSNNFFVSRFAKINAGRLRLKYNLHISINCRIGRGFYIGHGCNVFIAPSSIIGRNVSVHQCVTIGANRGEAARIGDDVYISPHVCITNDIEIGSNTVVGAGSVVIRSLEANSLCVGAPAAKIKDNPALYRSIINPYFED